MTDKLPEPYWVIAIIGAFTVGIVVGMGWMSVQNDYESRGYYDYTAHSSVILSSVGKTFNPDCVKQVVDEDRTFEIRNTWAISVNTGERSRNPVTELVVNHPNLSENKTRNLYGCMEPE